MRLGAVITLLVGINSTAAAQLPGASTAALGFADNFTAVARGYGAVAWNPALLGLHSNPNASLAILPVRGIAGLDPITLGDVADYAGQVVPHGVREQWLRQIEREGSEQGTGGGDVTWIAAQAGNFAIQLATTARAISNLSPGAAELLLFGNFGRNNEPHALALSGSSVKTFAATTMAASYGQSIGTDIGFGATLKYTIGHLLLYGEDLGTTFTEQPSAAINFPVVTTATSDFGGNSGSGVGLDIGVAAARGAWVFSVAIRNLINTFEWDNQRLVFRSGTGTFDEDTYEIDFDQQDFSSAPAKLQEFVEEADFEPVIATGAAFQATPSITVAADFRVRLGESTLGLVPRTHIGAGAEFRMLRMLPLRAGVALVDGGYQIAGGFGLNLGPVGLAASIARRDTDLGADTISMLTLISTMQ